MTRRAERNDARKWAGDNAVANELDEIRSFVLWGRGYGPPEELVDARDGNHIAAVIARAHDDAWDHLDPAERWVVIVRGDENDVDALVQEDETVLGYAPYLIDGKQEETPPGYMKGRLRSDVGPRRKVDQPRPYE